MRAFLLILGCLIIAGLGAYTYELRRAPSDPSEAELRREIRQLRTEVRRLRAERGTSAAATSTKPGCERSDTTMPDLRGMDVQLAQDTMQSIDVWAFVKHDATEKDRVMVWDRNWIVVRQDPRPCTYVDGSATVTVWANRRGD